MTQETQDTREDAQAVAETLQEIDDEAVIPMMDAVQDYGELAELSYEEWLTPVKLTGNQIVIEGVTCGVPSFWYEVHADLVHRVNTPGAEPRQVLPGNFMADMARMEVSERFELRPRLRSETKLGGGNDA